MQFVKLQPYDNRDLSVCLKPISRLFKAFANSLKDSGRHLSPESGCQLEVVKRPQPQSELYPVELTLINDNVTPCLLYVQGSVNVVSLIWYLGDLMIIYMG